MRVCHLLSGDLWAGAEVVAVHLLKGLCRYPELELFVILLNDGRPAQEVGRLGIPVHVIAERDISLLRLFRGVRSILSHMRPQIVHAHRYKENLLAALAAPAGLKSALVTTQHGLPERPFRGDGLKRRALFRLNFTVLSRRFHKVVAVSRNIGRILAERYSVPGERIEVIRNGVEVEDPTARKPEAHGFIIGSSGRLTPVKDYPLMIEVAKRIVCRYPEIGFVLAGEGPQAPHLQGLIANTRLEERFTLRGFVSRISDFYREIDLYLNTSVHEGIPMSVLEAMAHGLPVVAPKVGGFPEMIRDGVEGYLVEGRDPEAFAQRCLMLYKDPRKRAEMGRAARQRILNEFSSQSMADQYYRLYQQVLS